MANEISQRAREICSLTPVIPVLVVSEVEQAQNLATSLIAGELSVLEVTLRTSVALDVIQVMSDVPGSVVGAGTLITADDVRNAKSAGASFGVSPGATPDVISACEKEDLPLIPGSSTLHEAMMLLAKGYDFVKFFPAEASGGVSALKAFAEPVPQINFCPTGGVGPKNASDYLSLKNVLCVGGSWVAPPSLINANAWQEIEGLAKKAKLLTSNDKTTI